MSFMVYKVSEEIESEVFISLLVLRCSDEIFKKSVSFRQMNLVIIDDQLRKL